MKWDDVRRKLKPVLKVFAREVDASLGRYVVEKCAGCEELIRSIQNKKPVDRT